jgi:flagellin
MTLGILTNVSGLSAQRSLAESQKLMDTAMERLSSGQRINSAADDAAGLATAMRMESQIRGLDMAVKNTIDGQAMVQTIEGALSEVDAMLQRMRELAVQSANGTLRVNDRTYIENEKDALVAEIDRIQANTSFNGVQVFDGLLNTNFQVGANTSQSIAMSQASIASSALGGNVVNDGPADLAAAGTTVPASYVTTSEDLTITNTVTSAAKTTSAGTGDTAKTTAAAVNAFTGDTGVTATAKTRAVVSITADVTAELILGSSSGSTASTGSVAVTTTNYSALVAAINGISGTTGVTAELDASGSQFYLIDADGDDITFVRNDADTGGNFTVQQVKDDNTTTSGTARTVEDTTTGTDSLRIQGQVRFTSSDSFTIASAGTPTNGFVDAASNTSSADAISSLDLTTSVKASNALATLDGAIEKIASMRASLGAIDNRLDHTQSSLLNISEATSAAKSKITDADFATESANLSKAQVLQQAGTAMLAQANASPQMVLQLIQ